ncbi:MAG: hypothetical protein CO186_09470 [Zetaproteobacteria bacterium CG_4_9_14_3_um_filter_49_83]|nr:MAG: hypothetical protein AUJ56_12940 [Zetaproteobacteria bacterium CG1_02_49_23]PIQ30908.1 MAG: hypothetical protein COW62_11055 [Zetaproteobacteria bacterium CG17_big_fil_post_rev_8_21_14_2_50_50_13]PIV30835.1 MAG: hypothetical protein COS35_04485 [Zetaproteobacteria bacterium CG02_land_8_20_14_3_00_50_9]PIY56227.1 MAG: hypothetical protein COZ00_05320 [Zetaproteobacteria bacterium CG_4_10_14_0_8_um_filter_49_80]PJA34710.1 MAG: hypothetical protein CO186_09470 [Zetaproteobacteria bacterium
MSKRRAMAFRVEEDLSGNWCHGEAVATSQMEAISLVTPVLEAFFMRTVADALTRPYQADELSQRCLDFIREEANHSRAHRAFNKALLVHLGSNPPGLAMVESLLQYVRKHLSLSSQLLLAAALEHFAAVMSQVYVETEQHLNMSSAYARDMFAMHAREELDHCSVVFDLWFSRGATGLLSRMIVLLSILMVGGIYVAVSLPWILYRRSGHSIFATLKSFGYFIRCNGREIISRVPLRTIFAFVRRDYHPDNLHKA